MESDNIKLLEWLGCDSGRFIDEEKHLQCYELQAKELGSEIHKGPYDLSEVYIMRIVADHLPLMDFPTSEFFGQKMVWKCNMDLFETRQELISGDDFLNGGMGNVYYPKEGVKLSDIFHFDLK